MEVRGSWTPYERKRLECLDKSKTKQSDAKDADVNQIIKKALRNGVLPDPSKPAIYADLSTGQNFMDSMALVLNAQEQFQALPSEIRSEFHNDPAEFLDFANDPANNQRLIDLGVKERPL